MQIFKAPMNFQELDRSAEMYRAQILNTQKKVRFGPFKGHHYEWDSPTVVARSSALKLDRSYPGYSHTGYSNSFHGEVKIALEGIAINNEIGRRGDYRGSPIHPVGRCAEQHSADRCIFKNVNRIHINDLIFSIPLYTRTGEILAYCENCKRVFPNLRNVKV